MSSTSQDLSATVGRTLKIILDPNLTGDGRVDLLLAVAQWQQPLIVSTSATTQPSPSPSLLIPYSLFCLFSVILLSPYTIATTTATTLSVATVTSRVASTRLAFGILASDMHKSSQET
ncbi:hypothetical protein M9H77_30364 [Catharanthus roseus]|uniref:Uncharacterized protein n=1 Tax=Catharanthus roseus TaxID=4058 RepID=A0ACB9ZZN2_CATRO|nr:hypothetical protein M9H77_30364 [Catharanthus roseus]